MIDASKMATTIHIKHASDAPARGDGQRVMIDRLWPRGKSKEMLKLDLWLRDIAPSTELRKWFDHDPAKWNEFRKRCYAELKNSPEPVATLRGLLAKGTVTFVYAAYDTAHGNATALHEYFLRKGI